MEIGCTITHGVGVWVEQLCTVFQVYPFASHLQSTYGWQVHAHTGELVATLIGNEQELTVFGPMAWVEEEYEEC